MSDEDPALLERIILQGSVRRRSLRYVRYASLRLCGGFGAPVLSVRYEAGTVREHFSLDPASVTRTEDGMLAEYNLEGTRLQKYGVYFYSFSLCGEEAGEEHQITVYEKGISVPEWFPDTVIYQIFPERYYKAEDPNIQNKKNSFLYGAGMICRSISEKTMAPSSDGNFTEENLKGICGEASVYRSAWLRDDLSESDFRGGKQSPVRYGGLQKDRRTSGRRRGL